MLVVEPQDEGQQEQLGARLAVICPDHAVIYLQGDLGSGKTTLVRGFLRGLGHDGKVKSPTYTLIEPYELPGRTICHLDLYRLGDPEELEYLGIRDLMDGNTTLLIEWPERGVGLLPGPDLEVRIEYRAAGRRVEVRSRSDRGDAVLRRWTD